MIKATELRIGNWVNYKNEPFIIKAVALGNTIDNDKDDCVFEDMYAGYSIDEINPIPLTPDILEKAGFEYEHDQIGMTYRKGTLAMFFDYKDQTFGRNFGMSADDEDRIDVSLKYLHQLQNLYFALTGEELIIEYLEESQQKAKS